MTLLPRPSILIPHAILRHRGGERFIEIDTHRIRHAHGDEDQIAQLLGHIAFRFSALRLLEAGVVAQRARQLA